MFIGEGTPFSTLASQLTGQAGFSGGRSSLFGTNNFQAPSPLSGLDDLLDLSEEALAFLGDRENVFGTLREGAEQFRATDIELAFSRLRAVQERISIARDLLGNAGAEQRGIILNSLGDVGGELRNIGSQIGQIFSSSSTETSIDAVQGSFSQAFNGVAAGNGGAVSFAESLDVEFSFLRVAVSEESVEINRTEDGIEIERTSTQTELVVAQLSVEREQTLSVSGGGGNGLEGLLQAGEQLNSLLNEFQNTVTDFISLLEEVLDLFEGANTDFPEQLATALEEFLKAGRAFTEAFETLSADEAA